DIPLLIETGNIEEFDAIVVVYCTPDKQIERLIKRDNISEEEARERIESQMPLKDKLLYADYIIDNNGTKIETEREVKNIWSELLKRLDV
ncbi:MAG: dephospho-CoA kinase, partial [Nitrospinae bacterium]|nr:dephospho-CoA kinase [Nitrospinota bacterium]